MNLLLTSDLVDSLFAFGSEQAGRLSTLFRLAMFSASSAMRRSCPPQETAQRIMNQFTLR